MHSCTLLYPVAQILVDVLQFCPGQDINVILLRAVAVMRIDLTGTDIQATCHQATNLVHNLPKLVYGGLCVILLFGLAFNDEGTIGRCQLS